MGIWEFPTDRDKVTEMHNVCIDWFNGCQIPKKLEDIILTRYPIPNWMRDTEYDADSAKRKDYAQRLKTLFCETWPNHGYCKYIGIAPKTTTTTTTLAPATNAPAPIPIPNPVPLPPPQPVPIVTPPAPTTESFMEANISLIIAAVIGIAVFCLVICCGILYYMKMNSEKKPGPGGRGGAGSTNQNKTGRSQMTSVSRTSGRSSMSRASRMDKVEKRKKRKAKREKKREKEESEKESSEKKSAKGMKSKSLYPV